VSQKKLILHLKPVVKTQPADNNRQYCVLSASDRGSLCAVIGSQHRSTTSLSSSAGNWYIQVSAVNTETLAMTSDGLTDGNVISDISRLHQQTSRVTGECTQRLSNNQVLCSRLYNCSVYNVHHTFRFTSCKVMQLKGSTPEHCCIQNRHQYPQNTQSLHHLYAVVDKALN